MERVAKHKIDHDMQLEYAVIYLLFQRNTLEPRRRTFVGGCSS